MQVGYANFAICDQYLALDGKRCETEHYSTMKQYRSDKSYVICRTVTFQMTLGDL